MRGLRDWVRRLLRNDDGFTLIELLVTMAVVSIVLSAIVITSVMFGRTSGDLDRLTEAEDRARLVVRDVSRDVREAGALGVASPVVSAAATELVLRGPGQGAAATWIRYCTVTVPASGANPASRAIRRSVYTGTAYPGTPPACGISNSNWTIGTSLERGLSTSVDPFVPQCVTGGTTCAAGEVSAIGLRIAMLRRDRQALVLRSAVSFRNRPQTS